MAIEVYKNQFYPATIPLFIILRYTLVILTYFMFAPDYDE
jgi:hypothetical protein